MAELAGGSAFSAGDWLASRQLLRIMYAVARDAGLKREDAEDVGQELSLAVWNLRSPEPITAALVREIARNKTRDFLRARGRERRQTESWRGSAPKKRPGSEALLLLRARIAKLPANLRSFCQMHFVEGLSEREIASALHVRRGVVRGMSRVCQRVLGDARGDRRGGA